MTNWKRCCPPGGWPRIPTTARRTPTRRTKRYSLPVFPDVLTARPRTTDHYPSVLYPKKDYSSLRASTSLPPFNLIIKGVGVLANISWSRTMFFWNIDILHSAFEGSPIETVTKQGPESCGQAHNSARMLSHLEQPFRKTNKCHSPALNKPRFKASITNCPELAVRVDSSRHCSDCNWVPKKNTIPKVDKNTIVPWTKYSRIFVRETRNLFQKETNRIAMQQKPIHLV